MGLNVERVGEINAAKGLSIDAILAFKCWEGSKFYNGMAALVVLALVSVSFRNDIGVIGRFSVEWSGGNRERKADFRGLRRRRVEITA